MKYSSAIAIGSILFATAAAHVGTIKSAATIPVDAVHCHHNTSDGIMWAVINPELDTLGLLCGSTLNIQHDALSAALVVRATSSNIGTEDLIIHRASYAGIFGDDSKSTDAVNWNFVGNAA